MDPGANHSNQLKSSGASLAPDCLQLAAVDWSMTPGIQ